METTLAVDAPPPTDPLARDFVSQAYRDAYRYIGQPFPDLTDPGAMRIVYTRLDAVTKQVCLLGEIKKLG